MANPSITVRSIAQIGSAIDWVCRNLSKGLESNPVVITLSREKRSNAQNSKMWPMLEDIVKSMPVWHGVAMSKEDYKDLLTAAVKQQRVVPNVDGNGLVALGERTSKYSKKQMSELIEYMYWFGQDNDVQWSEKALEIYQEYREANNG